MKSSGKGSRKAPGDLIRGIAAALIMAAISVILGAGPAVAADAVGGLERLSGVEIPKYSSVASIVGAEMAIERPGEDYAGDGSWRGHLRRAAAELAGTGRLWGIGVPCWLSGAEIQREQASPADWFIEIVIGERKVGVAVIGCASPFDAAERAAMSDAGFPEQLAVMRGIDGVDHSGFLRQQ